MNNTIYIADTCALRNPAIRRHWEQKFADDCNFKLNIPYSVFAELSKQKSKAAKDALRFIEEHEKQMIRMPRSNTLPNIEAADNEIFYYCFIRQDLDIVLYTEDKGLKKAIKEVQPSVTLWEDKEEEAETPQLPHDFAERYNIFLTAACVNSAAFPIFVKKADSLSQENTFLSQSSLPLITENGMQAIQSMEQFGAALTLLHAGRIAVGETDEILAYLLSYAAEKPFLLILGEKENATIFRRFCNVTFSALKNPGFGLARLRNDGTLYLIAEAPQAKPAEQSKNDKEEPKQSSSEQTKQESSTTGKTKVLIPPAANAPVPLSKKAAAVPLPKDTAKEQAPKQKAQANEISAEDAEDMNAVKQFIEDSKIGKAHKLMEKSDELLWRGINYCQRNIKRTQQLYNLIELVKASGKKVPSACFIAYVFNILNQKAKKEEHLQKRLEHDVTSKSIQKIIEISEVPLRKHEAAIEKLKELQHENGAAVGKLIQKILDSVSSHNSTAQKK